MVTYTTCAIGVGGYVTAWIARRSQLALAAIMGAIEVAFTLYVMIAAPFHEAHPAPRWIWIPAVILMIPASCLGATIRDKQAHPAPLNPALIKTD
jgi:NADH:ubiquinone oxidoreductase subunit 5 (subunit L)/multisubunit Na+/H+ antiporter MnhA subunit